MAKKVTMHIAYGEEDKKEIRDIEREERLLKDRREKLLKKYKDHQEIKVAHKLTHYTNKPLLTLGRDYLKVEFTVHEVDADPKAEAKVPYVSPFYMDPKVLNTLLHGKLLSANEKKALLNKAHPGLDVALSGADLSTSRS